ncbi:MAG: hypothetical protein V4594_24065 [Bacteroidota bacterium]
MRSFKFIALFAFLFSYSSLSFAQLKFLKTYEQAVKEAKTLKVPIFILVSYNTTSEAPGSSDAAFYRDNFANYQVRYDSPEGIKLSEKYGLKIFPAFVFVNTNGSLIMKSHYMPGDEHFFFSLGSEAIQQFRGKTGLSVYDQRYAQDSVVDRFFLYDYISLRISSRMYDNDKLIDRYVDFLTARDQDNYHEVLFIHQAGPILYGKAYNFANGNGKIVHEIYANEPLRDRIWINVRIINNTLAEAIRKKDHALYEKLSSFVYNTVAPDYKKIDKQSALNRLIFYRGINDTAGFYRQARTYYDSYFMSISMDSIKLARTAQLRQDPPRVMSYLANPAYLSAGTIHDNNILNTAFTLNNAAWDFYTYGTTDPVPLSKALSWSQRAIDIDPKATHYDTLAHLLYRMGLFDVALFYEDKAIRLARRQKELSREQIKGFKKEAKKMKDRTL